MICNGLEHMEYRISYIKFQKAEEISKYTWIESYLALSTL